MPRTDAVQFFLELAAEWRRLGAEVTFEPGWERRGNGTSPAYEGGVVHHTAFLSSFANPFPALGTLINGRLGLTGPLANVGGPVCPVDKPRLHIISAFPANHAGASGGRSMGPLPTTSLFNRLVVGLEIDYAGLGPMIGGQRLAALIFTRGLANVLARSVEYIRAHAETSITGKWDPGIGNGKTQTIDMAAFRRDAANLTPYTAAAEEENSVKYKAFRSDPGMGTGADKGTGEMALAAPGQWYSIPDPAYWNLMLVRGIAEPAVNVPHNEFNYFKGLYEAADDDVVAELMAKLPPEVASRTAAALPAPQPVVAPAPPAVTGSITDPAFISALADELLAKMDARARDGDPATGPAS